MQLTCPTCAAAYQVPDDAIGPNGRKIRCRACGTSWHEPGRIPAPPLVLTAAPRMAPPPAPTMAAPAAPAIADAAPVAERESPAPHGWHHRRGPWLLLGLVALVAVLGVVAAMLALGPRQMASRLGLGGRVPLGIEITRQPDWRMIAGGSQLFAVSGRIWNPTAQEQPVPDVRAELKDRQGRTVYAWTITRPAPRLAPGQSATFDGAAVDVPRESANISVSFAGSDGK